MFPKEHGAWNALFICLIAGWIALGHFHWAGAAVTGLWVCAFTLRGPWNIFRQYRKVDRIRARKALGFMVLLGAFFSVALVLFLAQATPLSLRLTGWAGLPLAVSLSVLMIGTRNLRFPLAEVLGFSYFALVIPVLFLLDGSHELPMALWLWGLFGGYFLLGLASVKVRQKWLERTRKGNWLTPADRFSQSWWVLLLFAVWVEVLGDYSGGKLILMAPPLYASLKTLVGIVWGRPDTPMMRLGIWEMVHSIIFTSIWILTWTS